MPATTLSHQSLKKTEAAALWLRGSFACVFRVIAHPRPLRAGLWRALRVGVVANVCLLPLPRSHLQARWAAWGKGWGRLRPTKAGR